MSNFRLMENMLKTSQREEMSREIWKVQPSHQTLRRYAFPSSGARLGRWQFVRSTSMTNRGTNRTEKQTNKQTNQPTNQQTNKQLHTITVYKQNKQKNKFKPPFLLSVDCSAIHAYPSQEAFLFKFILEPSATILHDDITVNISILMYTKCWCTMYTLSWLVYLKQLAVVRTSGAPGLKFTHFYHFSITEGKGQMLLEEIPRFPSPSTLEPSSKWWSSCRESSHLIKCFRLQSHQWSIPMVQFNCWPSEHHRPKTKKIGKFICLIFVTCLSTVFLAPSFIQALQDQLDGSDKGMASGHLASWDGRSHQLFRQLWVAAAATVLQGIEPHEDLGSWPLAEQR